MTHYSPGAEILQAPSCIGAKVDNTHRLEQIIAGKRGALVGGVVILLLLLVVYWPSLNGSWLVDDGNYVVENHLLKDGEGLGTIWTDLKASKQYYPLVFTSLWLDYQAWGLNPLGYHLVNLFLHLLNSLLIWWLLNYLGLKWAWVAAAVFAVHPIHVESVAWITERKNVLSTFYFLVALIFYLKFALGNGRQSVGPAAVSRVTGSPVHYFLAVGAFVLALLSKTSTATFCGVVLVVLWWLRGRIRPAQVWPLLPFAGLGVGMGLVTVWLERTSVGATGGIFDITFAQRVQVAGLAVWHYASKIFWPAGLSFDYGRWSPDSSDWTLWLGPAGLATVLAGLWFLRQKTGRGPLTSVLLFLGLVFPALGFFNLYFFRYSYVADHFVYPASLGLICLGTGLGFRLRGNGRQGQRGFVLLTLVIVLGLSVTSWNHAKRFSSMTALCRSMLARNPTSWLGHNNLGDQLMKDGRLQEALLHLQGAEAIAPDRLETQLNLAICNMNLKYYSAAAEHARRAIELGPQVKFGYNLLGEIHLRIGDLDRSVAEFKRALALDPAFTGARANLGAALAQLGRFQEAAAQLEQVVLQAPDLTAARSNLGIALVNLGQYTRAVEQFEAALENQPENSALQQNLALAKSLAAGQEEE